MAHIYKLKTFADPRGNLTVIEKEIPFPIMRIFYIYGVDDSVRGKHRHHKTEQFLVALQGSCKIVSCSGDYMCDEEYLLNDPSHGLFLAPGDWHYMMEFSRDCILQVFASSYFDHEDYIYEPYKK
ncbi:MAG: WxcM-like domain-containing protein [Candidatus Margulisiibacteriota bacterium]|nr:MAG: WxcM-like domain-containing protein [Candidatus Margulisiibacteriota bacterium]